MNNEGIAGKSRSLIRGALFALGACFIWGLIFVVPQFLESFSAFEIAMGRFGVYGAISSVIFLRYRAKGKNLSFSLSIWVKATLFSLGSTFGYYIFLISAVKRIDPSICTLIFGVSPLTIAIMGNWRGQEISLRKLFFPFVLIISGLVIINVPHFKIGQSFTGFLVGIVFCLISLSFWTWYVVGNAKFLKNHPEVPSGIWSTLIGITTLFWVGIFGLFSCVYQTDAFSLQKFSSFGAPVIFFIVGSLILGVLCSWLGAYLWNEASVRLPVSLAGQLTIFETVFGFLFCYLVIRRFPPSMELLGMLLLLSAVIYSVRLFTKREAQKKEVDILDLSAQE